MSQVFSAEAVAGQTRSCEVTEGNQRHDRSTRLTMDSSILLYTIDNGLFNTALHDGKWTLQYCTTRLTMDSSILLYTMVNGLYTIDNALFNTALHDGKWTLHD